jgi:hypothetical protein
LVVTRKTSSAGRWLLLIHQLPPKPDYFRVKIWRRLQAIGAVAMKNSVYVLPFTDDATEDFQWLRREITAGGGEATVCRASFVDGMTDQQMEALFRSDQEATSQRPADGKAIMKKQGRTWVTRPDVHVDRIASAWLIRRFIDPKARFAFGDPAPGMIRFDMFEGEYTHEADRCTFETLLKGFGLEKDAALRAIGEMVHDVDFKDEKFHRQETPGFDRMIAGVVKRHAKDTARISRGAELLDTLYESFPAPQQRRRSH